MRLYVDGGCSGNGGPSPQMRWVVCTEDSDVVREGEHNGGSNNIAEYIAVSDALEYATEAGGSEVEILTDSKSNTSWWRRGPNSKMDQELALEVYERIKVLRGHLDAKLTWVPRHQNLAGLILERNPPPVTPNQPISPPEKITAGVVGAASVDTVHTTHSRQTRRTIRRHLSATTSG